MLTRRTMMLAAATLAATCTAVARPAAADTSARAFVAEIYSAYEGKNANGHPLDDARTVRRYFEPGLAKLIIDDQKAAAKKDEVGALDSDPFVDAQDWDIAAFDISVVEAGPDKATATVKFNNMDKAATVILDLVRLKNEWKINNITWQRDDGTETLRELFKH